MKLLKYFFSVGSIMRLKNSAFKLHPNANYFMCSGDGLECFLSYSDSAVVFFHPPWHIDIRYAIKICLAIRKLKRRNIDVVVCCNQLSESRLMQFFGISAYHLNQNMHLPEQLYRPINSCSAPVYDAIYVAQARKFKRLSLARGVERLYVLTYRCDFKDSEGKNDLHSFEPHLSHCEYNKEFIYDKDDVCSLYAHSACGLALSKKEGAMWASMEYLMAGLPVVTTKNIGGRDHYLNDDYTKWVVPTANGVREGVKFFVQNPLDRDAIREQVLHKVRHDRYSFLEVLNDHLVAHGFPGTTYEYIWGEKEGILRLYQPIQ